MEIGCSLWGILHGSVYESRGKYSNAIFKPKSKINTFSRGAVSFIEANIDT